MDICIPKSLTLTGAEKLNWITDIAFKPLSLKCCRGLHRQKRHRRGCECNLFSRIQNWVNGLIDELECSTSLSIFNSDQVQLSPKDSGIDINSPSRKEDGNMSNLVMPDSRSEERKRTSSYLKKRRLSLAENLVSKMKLEVQNSQKISREESKSYISSSISKPPETILRSYKLISNANENRPLVIKLRACKLEPETSVSNANEAGVMSPVHTELSDISSTMHPTTVMSCDDTLRALNPCPSRKTNHMPLHQVRTVSTVVSSTTRCRQKKKLMQRDRQCTKFSTTACSDIQAKNDSTVSFDNKFPKILFSVDNETICEDANFVNNHEAFFRQTLLPSNRSLDATKLSSSVNIPSDVFHSDHSSTLANQEMGTGAVTSSCGVVAGEETKSYFENFNKKKLDFRNSLKDKKTTGEFTKSAKSLDQSLRHLPTGFQASRRHSRIFRRSTLVPQLHQKLVVPKVFTSTEDLERHYDEFFNDSCERILCATFDDFESFKTSTSDVRMQGTETTVDEMESEALLNEILCDLPTVDFLSQEDSEAIPNILCERFLTEAERNDDIILDELLFQLPVTSSFKSSLHCSKIIPDDLIYDMPNVSLSDEDLFISDQKQLIQLRRGVFCLLRTLVPQLRVPDRFDAGGHAVDELVDTVCGELSDSEKKLGKSKVHPGGNVCLNSTVELCRTPGECLSRLRCKVLAMLRLLLGIDVDEFDNENLLHSLLDSIVSANYHDEELLGCDMGALSPADIPMFFSASESIAETNMNLNTSDGDAVEEVSSIDSFSDIPELLVESERKSVLGDMDDFPEPPKLTAVDERYSCQ